MPFEASGCSGELQRCYPSYPTPQTIIFMDYWWIMDKNRTIGITRPRGITGSLVFQ